MAVVRKMWHPSFENIWLSRERTSNGRQIHQVNQCETSLLQIFQAIIWKSILSFLSRLASADLFHMTISQVHFSSRSRSSILNFPAGQVPVVRNVDSVIRWINLYPLTVAELVFLILIHWIVIYLVDSAIQGLNNRGQLMIFASRINSLCQSY